MIHTSPGTITSLQQVWNPDTLTYVPMTQPGSAAASGGLTNTELRAADVKITLDGETVAIGSSALPTGASTEATLAAANAKLPALGQALAAASTPVVLTAAQVTTLTPPAAITGFLTEADFDAKTGSLTEGAPASDTASSGLNGRLQRVAQRLTSLISALGSPFQAGGSIGNTSFGSTQSGVWTVQPGNTANTTAWKTDGSAVTQPVSGPLTDAQIRATPLAVTGGGGGTEYTEDAVAPADPVGTTLIVVRQDTPSALVSANGDHVALRGTNYGAAYSQIVTSAGAFVDTFGGGTQYADAAARGTATGTLAMGDDGTNIQSIKVDAAGELQVDVLTMPTVAVTGNNFDIRDLTFAADKVDASGTVLGASTNNIGDVDVLTLPALVAGSALVGKVGIDQTTPGTTNAVFVTGAGVISTVNSSTANLAANAVFTGTSEDVSGYANISVSVFASHVSATDGLSVQQSSDGTNWDLTDVYTIPAATGKTFNFGVAAKFYRLVYTNGATLTTSLRIQTLYTANVKRGSSIRPQDTRTNDNDFEEVATYLNLFNGTSWDRARGTIANGLAVDVTRVGGVAPSFGDGVSGTGTQRVTLPQELTYSAGLTIATATAAGTGIFFEIAGSATKTIRLKRIRISGTVATGAKNGDIILTKRSAATSAGTATTLTQFPFDSANAAGTSAAVKYYTVLGTAGASVGVLDTGMIYLPLTGTGTDTTPLEFAWDDVGSEFPTLRGVSQFITAHFGTTTTNAPTLLINVTWTEK